MHEFDKLQKQLEYLDLSPQQSEEPIYRASTWSPAAGATSTAAITISDLLFFVLCESKRNIFLSGLLFETIWGLYNPFNIYP